MLSYFANYLGQQSYQLKEADKMSFKSRNSVTFSQLVGLGFHFNESINLGI